MKKSRKAAFEPKTFLAKVGDGKTITEYQKDQVVFSQGGEADAVFYIQRGKIKLTVVSERIGRDLSVWQTAWTDIGSGRALSWTSHPVRRRFNRPAPPPTVCTAYNSIGIGRSCRPLDFWRCRRQASPLKTLYASLSRLRAILSLRSRTDRPAAVERKRRIGDQSR